MGSLVEIRPGRRIWIEAGKARTDAPTHVSNTVAILVHGSCARSEQYAAQIPELQKMGIATVAFDYLGCGRSEKPDEFTAYAAQELYKDLVAVFDRYSKGFARAVLVGHSYGCYLVNKLATEQPDRVAAVVLIGAGYPTPDYARMRWIFNLPTIVLAWMQPYLTDQFIKLAFHPETFKTNPQLIELERGRSMENPPYMFRAFHLQAITLFKDPAEVDSWLRSIRAPVLVAAGDKDFLTPLDGMGKKVASLIKDARIAEIPLGGHQVHEEQPAALNAKIVQFLNDALSAG
ncbi:Protein ABHD8 [Coccomyxa sp. Obi]|nr:Protein ABHD8 [Coccomyxa sp. Obi]